jgi:acetyl-CoA carboxylase beta subunit
LGILLLSDSSLSPSTKFRLRRQFKKEKRDICGRCEWDIGRKGFRKIYPMKQTIIVKCTKCGGLMLTAKGQKTKICPYCGTHVDLLKAQKVASAADPFEASEILRRLKSEQGFSAKL